MLGVMVAEGVVCDCEPGCAVGKLCNFDVGCSYKCGLRQGGSGCGDVCRCWSGGRLADSYF